MTKTFPSLDNLDRHLIQNDVDKLKRVISQIISYARNDYPYKDQRYDFFKSVNILHLFVKKLFINISVVMWSELF